MNNKPKNPTAGRNHADAAERLVTWLAEGARLTEMMLNGLSPGDQARVATGIEVGGEIELRMRIAAHMVPRLSLVLVGDRGSIELVRS